MFTILVAKDEEKIKELLTRMLKQIGNTNIDIVKQGEIVKILKEDEIKDLVSLKDKVIQLEESLYNEKKGKLYKAVLEAVEKPLIERILERTEGNQLKAARVLGINRNTMRAKVKRLGIEPGWYKQ